jgi:hypothetical protein
VFGFAQVLPLNGFTMPRNVLDPTRQCYLCHQWFPSTTEFFYTDGRNASLSRRCKPCSYAKNRKWKEAHPYQKKPPRKRRCDGCGVLFLGPYQRKCSKCVESTLRFKGLKVFRTKSRTLRGCASTRAKQDGVEFSISHEFITQAFASTPDCPVCGIRLNYEHHGTGFNRDSPSIDRLDPKVGYTVGNVSVICVRCNILKQNATAEELERVARWIRVRTIELKGQNDSENSSAG